MELVLLFLQLLNAVGRKFNLIQPLLGFLKIRQNVLDAGTVFALELVNCVEPFFNLLELPFRVAQIIPHRAKLVRRVLDAVHKVRDFLIERFHVGADSVHPGKRVLSIG